MKLPELENDVAHQAARRSELRALCIEELRAFVREENGVTTMKLEEHAGEARLVLWFCRALLEEGETALANSVIEGLAWEANAHFNAHFVGVASMLMLLQHQQILSAAAIEKLETYVLTYISDWMTEDFRIHGANDNAGIECAAAVALAGQYFENPDLIAWAKGRYARPLRTLELREYLHECNSPTYSAVSLSTLTELAALTSDNELREAAQTLAHQVWRELLTHFHPIIRHQIGPFSRTFADDSANQCSLVMMLFGCALGEVSPFNPRAMLFPPPDKTFAHNAWLFQWASLACLACAEYSPPLELVAQSLNRALPFEIVGSNEFSPMGSAPGGQSVVRAFAEENWALSYFGSRPGAGTAAHLMYRRHEIAPDAPLEEHLRNVRSLTTRCTVSSEMANFQLRDAARIEAEVTREDGAAFCVGNRRTLLMGYVPIVRREAVRTIKSSVIFPTHFSAPEEVRVGANRVAGSASFPQPDWCFVRDGEIFLAIRPLPAQNRGLMFGAQQWGAWPNYATLSVFTMCGFAPHDLSDDDLRALGSGFVIEIASAREGRSFDEWCEEMQSARIDDFQWDSQRELRYRRGEVDLELIYDYRSLNLRRAAVNGKLE